MSKVTAFEAKTRFGELLERVSRGEEVVITRHDKVVARHVPEGPQGWTRFVAPCPDSSSCRAHPAEVAAGRVVPNGRIVAERSTADSSTLGSPP